MPRGSRVKSSIGIYHIMLRGANRQEIFHDDEDCIKFLETIEKCKIKTELSVYGWCLMSNHVHLLLKEGNENISNVMYRIGVSLSRTITGNTEQLVIFFRIGSKVKMLKLIDIFLQS